jgi:hypothetical protein
VIRWLLRQNSYFVKPQHQHEFELHL